MGSKSGRSWVPGGRRKFASLSVWSGDCSPHNRLSYKDRKGLNECSAGTSTVPVIGMSDPTPFRFLELSLTNPAVTPVVHSAESLRRSKGINEDRTTMSQRNKTCFYIYSSVHNQRISEDYMSFIRSFFFSACKSNKSSTSPHPPSQP